MPRIIAQNRIARVTVSARRITSPGGGGAGGGSNPLPFTFRPGGSNGSPTTSFWFPTRPGLWKLVMWGASQNAVAGRSGCYGEITKRLGTTTSVKIELACSVATGFAGLPQGDSRITFPDGTVCIAQGGVSHVPAVGVGFDLTLAGSAGGSAGVDGVAGLGTGGGLGGADNGSGLGGGAGAPAMLPFRGGNGVSGDSGNSNAGNTPGAGGSPGGQPLLICCFLGD